MPDGQLAVKFGVRPGDRIIAAGRPLSDCSTLGHYSQIKKQFKRLGRRYLDVVFEKVCYETLLMTFIERAHLHYMWTGSIG